MTQRTLQFTETERRRASSHAAKILDLLREGPQSSTTRIEIASHRFSARIYDLRQQGHNIEVEKKDDCTSIHTLVKEAT